MYGLLAKSYFMYVTIMQSYVCIMMGICRHSIKIEEKEEAAAENQLCKNRQKGLQL